MIPAPLKSNKLNLTWKQKLDNVMSACQWGAKDPQGSKFFQFHAVFRKVWQNRMLVPPWGVNAPPRGNPGSATDSEKLAEVNKNK